MERPLSGIDLANNAAQMLPASAGQEDTFISETMSFNGFLIVDKTYERFVWCGFAKLADAKGEVGLGWSKQILKIWKIWFVCCVKEMCALHCVFINIFTFRPFISASGCEACNLEIWNNHFKRLSSVLRLLVCVNTVQPVFVENRWTSYLRYSAIVSIISGKKVHFSLFSKKEYYTKI